MEKIILPFSKIFYSDKDKIAEIIINDGELICIQKTAFLHEALLNKFKSNFYLLINKKNSYCYTYKAQLNLADIPTIKAIAIVNYSKTSLDSSNYVMNFGKKSMIKHKNFYDKESALSWLKTN
jgi:hypothetical protein